jgi:chromosome segregation ATPase
MPISGPVVHQQLMAAYANLQTKLESSRGRVSEVDEDRNALDDDRSEALVRLAEHYLPELTPQAVRDTWREIRPAISDVLLRKQEHTDRIASQLASLIADREQSDIALVELNQQLDQATDAQQELADQVEQELREDSSFVELSDRAAVAEAALERAEANLEEIENDADMKLPAYKESSLFSYLRERGFGTGDYKKRGFTRRMDRILAKFIDYNKAKQNYEFLIKTPQQMKHIIEEDRKALNTVMDELEKQRDRVAEKLGLPAKIAVVEQLEQQRSEQLTSLDETLQETETVQHQLNELDDSRGKYYREAIQIFREMLERSDSRELKRLAQSTEELTDDQIVARLMGVESELTQLDDAEQDRRRDLSSMQQTLDNLGRLIQRFRAAKFDSSRSQFVGSLDILEDLDRAVDPHDIDGMWDRIRKAQRWGPTAMEQVTRVATDPMKQVLINAMAHAAGAALEQHARRAGDRRGRRRPEWGGSWSGTWGGDSSGWYRRR